MLMFCFFKEFLWHSLLRTTVLAVKVADSIVCSNTNAFHWYYNGTILGIICCLFCIVLQIFISFVSQTLKAHQHCKQLKLGLMIIETFHFYFFFCCILGICIYISNIMWVKNEELGAVSVITVWLTTYTHDKETWIAALFHVIFALQMHEIELVSNMKKNRKKACVWPRLTSASLILMGNMLIYSHI